MFPVAFHAYLRFKQSRIDELLKEQIPEKMRLKLDSLLAKAKRPDLQESLNDALLQFIQLGYDLKFIEAESHHLIAESPSQSQPP